MSQTLQASTLLAVPMAPLVGSALAGIFGTRFGGNKIGRGLTHSLTILGVFIAFVLSAMTLQSVAFDGARFNETLYTWMVVGDLKMEIGFMIDGLTAMMMCVVTFVSLMVHLYTIGYMEEDEGYNRFFSYISLFTFSMQQHAPTVLRLGSCGLGVLPVDRFLVQQTHGDLRKHEGLLGQPRG
jgi:NADH-quinone oxidoreductase subunit L